MGFSDGRPAAKTSQSPRPRKQPKRITAEYLERAALYYLERYSSSEANLRRVLTRKVYMSCRHHGNDPAQFTDAIEAVVARKIVSGLIDDVRYAENRVASLKRRGTSLRMIGLKLGAKGVDRESIAEATRSEPEDELASALIAARRKRLGPWRTRGSRADWRQKDIAVLMRAGFGSSVARAVIDGAAESGEDAAL